MSNNEPWVFAVDKWETGDNKHHVHYGPDNNPKHTKTKIFSNWKKAQIFAREKAIQLGLKEYQIDTPSRPHEYIKITGGKIAE